MAIFMENIGAILKQLRTIYGDTAKDFSQRLLISPSYLSEIENGKKQPSLEILEKYAHILDMKPSTVLLLAEKEDDLKKEGKTTKVIRKLMLKWISTMSKKEG
ncbi:MULTISPECIES: helix-turn-helix domain-containing protein [Lactobacillaceae]|uniref:helix-turn-helix domain-containing protein n=1 Tax=Lactobacillaceae TaxID=33958 RepID=UPI001CDB26E7|nr:MULTISPECIES: helix-turn-helix transcriptional regulator [Lactobacillaceae]MCE6032002.1 helix-turn-helix domain-containing protein [Lactiplantibacillus pentosus]MDT7002567.1 helix-turn-helix transcriptional regulator [Lactiplantibacillus pentosus]MDY1546654.1 helix-turn-helix transcriptional regulator [Lactiplantibacillus pentosus]